MFNVAPSLSLSGPAGAGGHGHTWLRLSREARRRTQLHLESWPCWEVFVFEHTIIYQGYRWYISVPWDIPLQVELFPAHAPSFCLWALTVIWEHSHEQCQWQNIKPFQCSNHKCEQFQGPSLASLSWAARDSEKSLQRTRESATECKHCHCVPSQTTNTSVFELRTVRWTPIWTTVNCVTNYSMNTRVF